MVPVTTPLRAEQPYLDRSIRLVEIGGLAGGHCLDPHLAKPVTYQDRRLMGQFPPIFARDSLDTPEFRGNGRQRGKNDEEKMG